MLLAKAAVIGAALTAGVAYSILGTVNGTVLKEYRQQGWKGMSERIFGIVMCWAMMTLAMIWLLEEMAE